MRVDGIVKAGRILARSAFLIFFVTLIARLWVVKQFLTASTWTNFYQYNEPSRIALSLVTGHGYSSPWAHTPLLPTAQQPPVYPLLLAAIFKLGGVYSHLSLWISLVLNSVFSALTAVLMLKTGSRLLGASAATLAAWVWALWPYEAIVAIRLWESSLSALLLMIALSILTRLNADSRISSWLVFGILAGIAVLTNTTLLSVFPLFWIWLWISHWRRGKSCAKVLATSVAVCVLLVMPWTIRNYVVFHRVIPIRDNFGLELWIGNHEGVTHDYPRDYPVLNPGEYNRLGEIGYMESRQGIALEFIRQHFGQFLRLSARRFLKFWTDPDFVSWLPISLLAWAGMVLAFRRQGMAGAPVAIVLLAFPLVYYVSHSFPSYRHPIEPEILLLASFSVAIALEGLGNRVLDLSSAKSVD
jgi:4-amino-4-deoxy-L-arabinose transferase-like glycosyltransferase